MNQRPSVFRLFAQIWKQNFRRQPVRTVLGTIVSSSVFIALVFFSFFFMAVFLVIGLAGVLYLKFFGNKAVWSVNAQYRSTKPQAGDLQGKVLEGEFREIDQVNSGSAADTKR